VFAAANGAGAETRPFNPIRKLTTWYTDRSLVDIEVVGSTSSLPELHRLEPNRRLRFRLERAYVHTLSAERGPGFESLSLGIDLETQLPDSLILAANQGERYREEIPGVPKLSTQEWTRRRVVIRFRSERSAADVKRVSDVLDACKGAPRDDQLLAYVEGDRCRPPRRRDGSRHIAQFDNNLLSIECQNETFPGLGCTLRFPFEGFAAELAFHRSHLAKWREVVERSSAFLKSKQYR
jgi:hypothetical protein